MTTPVLTLAEQVFGCRCVLWEHGKREKTDEQILAELTTLRDEPLDCGHVRLPPPVPVLFADGTLFNPAPTVNVGGRVICLTCAEKATVDAFLAPDAHTHTAYVSGDYGHVTTYGGTPLGTIHTRAPMRRIPNSHRYGTAIVAVDALNRRWTGIGNAGEAVTLTRLHEENRA